MEMRTDLTPVESALEMFVSKKRLETKEDDFHGKQIYLKNYEDLIQRPRRVGLESSEPLNKNITLINDVG